MWLKWWTKWGFCFPFFTTFEPSKCDLHAHFGLGSLFTVGSSILVASFVELLLLVIILQQTFYLVNLHCNAISLILVDCSHSFCSFMFIICLSWKIRKKMRSYVVGQEWYWWVSVIAYGWWLFLSSHWRGRGLARQFRRSFDTWKPSFSQS